MKSNTQQNLLRFKSFIHHSMGSCVRLSIHFLLRGIPVLLVDFIPILVMNTHHPFLLSSQRDEEDMTQLVRDCSSEFKEYYIQMQAAKRSQAPLPSQVSDFLTSF